MVRMCVSGIQDERVNIAGGLLPLSDYVCDCEEMVCIPIRQRSRVIWSGSWTWL